MSSKKLLLTAVFGPYGVKDDYAEGLGMQMELLNNQITREQGVHSPRQAYWSFNLYMMAENLKVATTVLDFPKWNDFTEELKKGYSHVGITFIVPNVLKVKRMTEYIREHHPEIRIILGGYGTIIPDLDKILPFDELCTGEGIRWLQEYFGEDTTAKIKHPAILGPAFESIYGFRGKPKGAILLPGIGCENGCDFCITSQKFKQNYISLLQTGKDVFEACSKTESELKSTGFSIMDENFLKHPDRAKELLSEMEKHNKPYVFDIFSSAEVIKQMGVDFLVRLGIHMLWVGVESKFSNRAKTKGIDLHAMIKELQDNGIIVNASSILFQDHHDQQKIREDIDWVINLDSNLVQFMNYTPYPTTTLYKTLTEEGRMNPVHYRHQHGQGELFFKHPYFNDPKDHMNYLRNAFRKKYQVGGPGVLNIALTAIKGYKKAEKDYADRQKKGLAWNPETLQYEKSNTPQPDEFMRLRIRKMQKIAKNIRSILLAAWLLAPNRAARKKARYAMKLFREEFGRPSVSSWAMSIGLAGIGVFESLKLMAVKAMGKETIIYQPPARKTENHSAANFSEMQLSADNNLSEYRPQSYSRDAV